MKVLSYTSIIITIYVCSVGTHHFVPTFFGRLDENSVPVNRLSADYNEKINSKPWINRISREDAANVRLEVWPSIVKNGEKVTVLWKNVTNPNGEDIIAYYCPFYDGVLKHYVDYFYAKVASEWREGYGHHDVNVINMRETCVFKYYRLSNKTYVLAGVSNNLNFADGGPFAPLQGHISLTNDPTQMRVMWVSGELQQPPVVRYGTTKSLEMKENAYILHSYTKDDLCQAPANDPLNWWHPGFTYDILLTNLKPNTLYYYSYGTDNFMSPIANFTTALPIGDPTPFNFVIYGDMGVGPYPQGQATAKNVKRYVSEKNPRFVSHIGDISYAMGHAYIWEQWGTLIESYATLVPYMVSIGNHEYDHNAGGIGRDPSKVNTAGGWKPSWFNGDHDSNGECGVPTYKRYHMPNNGNSLFWYSYDYGMVHMITMSTEHDYSPGSLQYQWLEKDLKSVDRKKTPWLFIGGHRPMYLSNNEPDELLVSEHMQILFEDLLHEHKVDIAFWGHQHNYERTCKVYKKKCVADGVPHIVVGMAGRSFETPGYLKRDWSLVHFKEYGYGRVTIANASSLLFEMFGNEHNRVMDSIWIHK